MKKYVNKWTTDSVKERATWDLGIMGGVIQWMITFLSW